MLLTDKRVTIVLFPRMILSVNNYLPRAYKQINLIASVIEKTYK